MNLWSDKVHDVIQVVGFVLIVAFAFQRKSGRNKAGAWRAPSAGRFFLNLIAAAIFALIAFVSVQFMREHPGDVVSFFALLGAIFGILFLLGFLLRALVEAYRVFFSARDR